MNHELRYFPIYLGLFFTQVLAISCNAFLDIQYGDFGRQVLVWTILDGISLSVAWYQKGKLTEIGKGVMYLFFFLSIAFSLTLFIPVWGLPRGALYMLAMLQVSYNCTVVTHRHLYFSLLMSLVIALFASSHYRADWTMLFYLVPFLVSAVFTLVATQINHKIAELQNTNLSRTIIGAQSIAIGAATLSILLLSATLYLLTPQVTWNSQSWQWGLPANASSGGDTNAEVGGGGGSKGGSEGEAGGSSLPDHSKSSANSNAPTKLKFSNEMRNAAICQGMPEWQSTVMLQAADTLDGLHQMLEPIQQQLQKIWQDFKEWLKENRHTLLSWLIKLIVITVCVALLRLIQESLVVKWLHSRFDYLMLVVIKFYGNDTKGARYCFKAMTRLFELLDVKRDLNKNTQEYSKLLSYRFPHLSRHTSELVDLYEAARFSRTIEMGQVDRMRVQYQQIYLKLHQ